MRIAVAAVAVGGAAWAAWTAFCWHRRRAQQAAAAAAAGHPNQLRQFQKPLHVSYQRRSRSQRCKRPLDCSFLIANLALFRFLLRRRSILT
jgi:hypothetical protein